MYTTSVAYRTAISAPGRTTRITGTITLADSTVLNITDANIVQNSLYFKEQCIDNEDLVPGSVYAAEMGLQLINASDDLNGAIVELLFGIDVGSGVYEDVPLGVFNVLECPRNNGVVSIKCLDNMVIMDTGVGTPPATGTLYDYIAHACTESGVTLATAAATINAMPNGSISEFAFPSGGQITTCRDLLMWATQLLAGFACFNRIGELEIRTFTNATKTRSIATDIRYDTELSGAYKTYQWIEMDGQWTSISVVPAPPKEIVLHLPANPFLKNPPRGITPSSVRAAILNECNLAAYQIGQCDILGDPALELGDIITLTGGVAGDGVDLLVMNNYWAYRGKQTIASVAGESLLGTTQTQFEKELGGKADLEYVTAALAWKVAYSGTLAPAGTADLSSYDLGTARELMVVFLKSGGSYRVPVTIPAELFVTAIAVALPDSTTGERCSFSLNTTTWVLTNGSETGIDIKKVYYR